jgi:hypothetical protein
MNEKKRKSAIDLLNHSFMKLAKGHEYIAEKVLSLLPQKEENPSKMIFPRSIAGKAQTQPNLSGTWEFVVLFYILKATICGAKTKQIDLTIQSKNSC